MLISFTIVSTITRNHANTSESFPFLQVQYGSQVSKTFFACICDVHYMNQSEIHMYVVSTKDGFVQSYYFNIVVDSYLQVRVVFSKSL